MKCLNLYDDHDGTTIDGQYAPIVQSSSQEGFKVTRPQQEFSKVIAAVLALGLLAACQPTVAVQAPKDPITINLNVKLDADVRVRLEEQAEEDIESKSEIF